MKLQDLFPSRFLKPHDLFRRGINAVEVAVEAVKFEEVRPDGRTPEIKPALHVRNGSKPILLNKGMGKAIASKYGDNVEDWIGKRITIVIANYRGMSVIRIQDANGEPHPIPIPANYTEQSTMNGNE